MRRSAFRVAVAVALFAFAAMNYQRDVSAQGTIGSTDIVVFEVDEYTKSTLVGTNVSYRWGLYNGGNSDYAINLTTQSSDSTFLAALSPNNFTILARAYRDIFLNISAPTSGPQRSAIVNVTIRAKSLQGISEGESSYSTVTYAYYPPIDLLILDVDQYQKDLYFSSSVSFRWAVSNQNDYDLAVNITVLKPLELAATAEPKDFLLPPLAYREIFINVTAPESAQEGDANLSVRFLASNVERGLAVEKVETASVHVSPSPSSLVKLVVIQMDQDRKTLNPGKETGFQWAIYNPSKMSLDVSVVYAQSDPSFIISLSPSNFTLAPSETRMVTVNVTAPQDAAGKVSSINMTFTATDPSSGYTFGQTFVVSVEAAPSTAAQGGSFDFLEAFLVLGLIIFIGFVATQMFEKTKVPDLLILLIVGLILGPVNALLIRNPVALELFNRDVLRRITPLLAALALMIILFDGGLNLNFSVLLKKLNMAFLHTMLAFVLTLVTVTAIAHYVLGYPPLVGLLLGAILGGISGAVVVSIVRRMSVTEDTKIILILESILTDVLCIILAIVIIEILREGGEAAMDRALGKLLSAFSVAIVIGVVFGLMWLKILTRVHGRPFSFMITVGALFVLYAFVEIAGSSGAMASLVFGLVLGNHDEFARMFRMQTRIVFDEKIRQFHSELSFLIRTFFFVFMGLVFTFQADSYWKVESSIPGLIDLKGSFSLFMIGAIAIFLGIVLVRFVSSLITGWAQNMGKWDRTALWSIMNRGLAAAVLASLPFTVPEFSSSLSAYFQLMSPYESQFLNITFMIIVFTSIGTSLGVVLVERALAREGRPKPAPRLLEGPIDWFGLINVKEFEAVRPEVTGSGTEKMSVARSASLLRSAQERPLKNQAVATAEGQLEGGMESSAHPRASMEPLKLYDRKFGGSDEKTSEGGRNRQEMWARESGHSLSDLDQLINLMAREDEASGIEEFHEAKEISQEEMEIITSGKVEGPQPVFQELTPEEKKKLANELTEATTELKSVLGNASSLGIKTEEAQDLYDMAMQQHGKEDFVGGLQHVKMARKALQDTLSAQLQGKIDFFRERVRGLASKGADVTVADASIQEAIRAMETGNLIEALKWLIDVKRKLEATVPKD